MSMTDGVGVTYVEHDESVRLATALLLTAPSHVVRDRIPKHVNEPLFRMAMWVSQGINLQWQCTVTCVTRRRAAAACYS